MRYLDRWIVESLDAAEAALKGQDYDALCDALAPLPLEMFTLLYFDRPSRWPTLSKWLPALPPEADQTRWTGSSGWRTMHQAAVFLEDAFAKYGRDLRDAKVLDYGCGWGRMLRLLYARVRLQNIHGVDPWPPSIELLRTVYGSIAQVGHAPNELPFNERFDLIYAYSVFTHIGPTSQSAILATLKRHIADDGLLALTVRPATFWEGPEQWPDPATKAALLGEHLKSGIAFIENPPAEGGLIDYGRCSVSLDYIMNEWREWQVDGVQWHASDSAQLTVFLRPR